MTADQPSHVSWSSAQPLSLADEGPWHDKQVAVSGAGGFIGRRLCHRISAAGGQVVALVRPTSDTSGLPARGMRYVHGDLTTGKGLAALVDGADVVVHLGGVTSALRGGAYWECNAHGTGRLAHAAASRPTPPVFVHCSSLAAAGPAPASDRPRAETDTPAPVSTYGRSKLAGEEAVRAWSDRMPVTVIRPPAVYGPGDTMLIPSVVPMVRAGLLVSCGLGDRGFSLIHVDDLCAALLTAALRAPRTSPTGSDGLYYVSDGRTHTWEGFTAALATALGRRPPRRVSAPAAAVTAAAALSELTGRLRGAPPALTWDKARELAHPWWTCADGKARREWGFTSTVELKQGLAGLFPHA
ncbi:NAD-dependent epimerase/dehydratase family protein [Streptomyces sp. NPDC051577]|uniref:NAD-dependent epimerase/dehydratase family protein n=1 Tax=Streptomyces sp. NPDC051577 TaxID=3155166 RepID=UPI0034167E5E